MAVARLNITAKTSFYLCSPILSLFLTFMLQVTLMAMDRTSGMMEIPTFKAVVVSINHILQILSCLGIPGELWAICDMDNVNLQ